MFNEIYENLKVNEYNKPAMELVKTEGDHDFYIGRNPKGQTFYNIVPKGRPAPEGGYYSKEFIERIKGVVF